jgi:hypothetical protein
MRTRAVLPALCRSHPRGIKRSAQLPRRGSVVSSANPAAFRRRSKAPNYRALDAGAVRARSRRGNEYELLRAGCKREPARVLGPRRRRSGVLPRLGHVIVTWPT